MRYGAAREPYIKILAITKDGVLLQCEAHGDPRPTIKWKDSENNILTAEEPQISDRGGRFYITVNITVTKTGNYRCVATQETLSHQIAAVIPVYIQAVRVVVEEDSDAVLPCLISTVEDLSGKYFVWRKDGQKEVFMYDAGVHSNNGLQGQDEQFKGRVSFFQDQLENGNASIEITRTKMADSGNYSCDFPRLQPRQTSIIELVVDPILKDRTGENIPGLAPKPDIDTLADTRYWRLLQCEAHGVPRPTIKWQDSDDNTLPAEEPQISDRGGRFYITVNINVTKTNNYRCVATQETLNHQVAAVIPVSLAVRVVVEEDSDAVLPCLIRTKEDISYQIFDWKKDGQKKKEVFMYDAGIHSNNGLPGQDDQFKGRVSHFQDQLENGSASIKITRTKMADSGNYSCDFPRHQPRQTSIIELVVDPVLKDRTGENIPGLAPEPVIKIVADTKNWILLQCEARGVSPLTAEWKNAAGNILKSESTPKSETGSPSSIALNITVTKTDNYSCVATQETLNHQVAAVTSVYIPAVRVVVEQDSDAVLPCLISTEEDLEGKFFDWRKNGQKEVFMYDAGVHYNNGRQGQDDQFKGRVSFFQDQLQNGDASIKITRTKMADSGTYSCDFPRHQPSQTSIIELVVGRVLRDRTGENISGAAPEPNIKILDETNHWRLLQCEAHGHPLPTLEWKDSDNNTLPADTPQISDRGGRSYITVKITVTKTDNYSCVATQEKFSHQIATLTYMRLTGSNTGWIIAVVVLIILLISGVILLVVLKSMGCITLSCKKDKKKSNAVELNPADQDSTTEPLKHSDHKLTSSACAMKFSAVCVSTMLDDGEDILSALRLFQTV